MIQIGSRNMQNSVLLRAASAQDRPILLKRGMAATIEEWLLAAEYCLVHGAPGWCSASAGSAASTPAPGTCWTWARWRFCRTVHGVPVVVDPSHATGRRDLIAPMSHGGAGGGRGRSHDRDAPRAGRLAERCVAGAPPVEFESLAREIRAAPAT
jgi:3-deoxy-7-phosphoheptulonate synthase